METESPTVQPSSAGNDTLIPLMYEDRAKGLRKDPLSFRYTSMEKPSELSRCVITVRDVDDAGAHESNYLNQISDEQTSSRIVVEQRITMGSATTPVDCYVELLLQQMLTNEESRCTIRTKANEITFIMKLHRIEEQNYYYEQDVTKMLEIAKRYKENGVKMFPKYPLFAHLYFNRAVKCILSWSPMKQLVPPAEGTWTMEELRLMLETLHLNISACLIKQKRFDEVPHVLQYTKEQEMPSVKATYRKALAHFMLKQYAEALATLQRADFANSKECVVLHTQILQARKQDDAEYNTMVKKMFG